MKKHLPHIIFSSLVIFVFALLFLYGCGRNPIGGNGHIYSWYITLVEHGISVPRSSLALDNSGHPRISYYDYWNEDLKYASWNDSTSSWEIETVESSGEMGLYSSLALDDSGNPRIAYTDDSDDIGGIVYLKFASWNNAASTWEIETVDGHIYPNSISLALDSSGRPRISYTSNGNLSYASWNDASSTWEIETIEYGGVATSLALDGSGRPRISYYDIITNKDLKYASWNDAASTWEIETVDSAGDVGVNSSLALDGSGYPKISYSDLTHGYLKYASWNDAASTWEIEAVVNVGCHPSLALDSNGHPRISYCDPTIISNYLIKYASWNDAASTWEIETVGNGSESSLALDGSGHPRISMAQSALRYAEWR